MRSRRVQGVNDLKTNWCKLTGTNNNKGRFACFFTECTRVFWNREDILNHVMKYDLEQHTRFGMIKRPNRPPSTLRRLVIDDTPPREDEDLATIMSQTEAEKSEKFYAKYEECTRQLQQDTSVEEVEESSDDTSDDDEDVDDDNGDAGDDGDLHMDMSDLDLDLAEFFDDTKVLQGSENARSLENLILTGGSFRPFIEAPIGANYMQRKYSKEEIRNRKWIDLSVETNVGGIAFKSNELLKVEDTSDNSSSEKTEERPCCSSSSSNRPSTSTSSSSVVEEVNASPPCGMGQLLDSGYSCGFSSSANKPISLDDIDLASILESSAKIPGRGRYQQKRKWKREPKVSERSMAKIRRIIIKDARDQAELEAKIRVEMAQIAQSQRTDEIMQPTESSLPEGNKRWVKTEVEDDEEEIVVPVVKTTVAPPSAPVAPPPPVPVAVPVTPPPISVSAPVEPPPISVPAPVAPPPAAPQQEGPLYYSYNFIYDNGIKNKAKFAKGGSQKPYHCPVPACPKTYKNANGLKYHAINGHNPPQIYRCDQCNKLYQTKSSLDKHNKTHTAQTKRAAPANGARSGKADAPPHKKKAVEPKRQKGKVETKKPKRASQPSDTESETEVDHTTTQQVQQTVVPREPRPEPRTVEAMSAWAMRSTSSQSGLSQAENFPYFHREIFGERAQQSSAPSLYSSGLEDSIKTPEYHREVQELPAIPTSSPISFDLDFDPSLLTDEVLEDSNDSADVGAIFQESMLYPSPSMPKLELVMHTPRKATPQYEKTYGLPPQLKRKDRSGTTPMTASQMYFHERAGPSSNMYYQQN